MREAHWHFEHPDADMLHLIAEYPYALCREIITTIEPAGCHYDIQQERENDSRCCERCRGIRDLMVVAE